MTDKMLVGWREIVSLPGLGISSIKAKVDTGARTSCIHAFQLEPFDQDGALWVRFWVHPIQNDDQNVVVCEAPVIDQRIVRDSGGHEETRYVIRSEITMSDQTWPIEITLTNRENMLFRMLLGRTAMHHRIIVDPTCSFLTRKEEHKE